VTGRDSGDGEADADVLRRHFVAVATADYESPQWGSLPVAGEVDSLQGWLCAEDLRERRFVPAFEYLSRNPTKRAVRDALEDTRWNESDAAVVFVTGHGERAHNTHWMILSETDPGRLHSSAQRTSDLVGWLRESGIRYLLLILDLCYAGRTIADTVLAEGEIPATWLALPSATKDEQATTGALTGAITGFLTELALPHWEKYGVHNRHLNVEDFLDEVERRLGRRLIPFPGGQVRGAHPCLPNPHYRSDARTALAPQRSDLALPELDLAAHWEPRARGVGDPDDAGWLFTGRGALMRRLIAFAQQDAGSTLLVTGGPGSGKSAVLARLVTLSDPRFLARYPAETAAIPEDLKPPPGAVDVAVLVTGKTAHEVIAQICEALGVPPAVSRQALPSLQEWIDAWQDWLARRQRGVTIVVDALDEAADPVTLLSEVLAQLAPRNAVLAGDGGFRLRLLIGVRSTAGPGESAERGGQGTAPPADLAERLLSAERVRVDERPWSQPGDITAYATEVLNRTPGSPYRRDREGISGARRIAEALAARAGTSFLVARIAAASLAHRAAPVDPADERWLTAVDEGVMGVFRDDLRAAVPDAGDRLRAVHLLRAVAFAYGRGLPWRQVWPTVANAMADDPERTYGDSDIAWLLGSRLGAYLVTDTVDDTTVYRLFHDALRTTLRDQWQQLVEREPR
jgi:hypothetical protein